MFDFVSEKAQLYLGTSFVEIDCAVQRYVDCITYDVASQLVVVLK